MLILTFAAASATRQEGTFIEYTSCTEQTILYCTETKIATPFGAVERIRDISLNNPLS